MKKSVRISAFFIFVLAILGFFYNFIFILIFIDFLLKIYFRKFCLTNTLSKIILKILKTKKQKMIDYKPKKFAAFIGLFCSFLILFFSLMGFEITKNILIILILIASFLEGFFGYCLGCKIYSFLQIFKK